MQEKSVVQAVETKPRCPERELINRESSLLLLVDMQERLMPAVLDHDRTLHKAALLISAAKRMGIPILASEQYPEGLGPTSPALTKLIPADCVMKKIHFSCLAEDACRSRITATGRSQMLICGAEAHVCVQQTAFDLQQAGHSVFVIADAIGSRCEEDKSFAVARMRTAGIVMVTTEMVLFEWMRRADTPLFREILPWIRGS